MAQNPQNALDGLTAKLEAKVRTTAKQVKTADKLINHNQLSTTANEADNQPSTNTQEPSHDEQPRTDPPSHRILANTPSDSVGRNATERATTSIHSKTGGKSTRRNQNQSDNGHDSERSSKLQSDGAQTELSSRIVFGERKGLFDLPPITVTAIDTQSLDFKDTKKLADEILRQLQGTDNLINDDTGWTLQVGKKDRQKMGDNKNLSHATSQAVQGITDLVKNAIVAETHQDIKHGNERVKAVHRLYVPAVIDGQLHRVKLTVKDYTLNDGTDRKNLHAIEAVEIENALLGTLPSDDKQGRAQPTTGHSISIADLLNGVKHDGDDGVFGRDIKHQPPTTALENAITTNDVAKIDFDELTPSQQSALNALEKLPDSDPKKAEFMDAIYGVGTTDSEQDKKARRELVGRITTYEMVKRNAKKLADELSELGYDVKVADSTLFDNTKEVATQLTAKKSGKTLNVMVNKTLPQGRSNDSVRDGFFVKDGNVSYRIDFNELNIAQRIDNHTDYVSNKEYFGVNRPVYRQNAKPTDWQQRMAGQMARLFDDDPALPQFIELANQRNLSTSHKNSLIGSITSYADVQFKKGNALQKDDVIGKNNDEYHQGKIKFSRMGSVVAPISEQAKVLQGEAVAVIDESTLDMPTEGGFKAIVAWASNLFKEQGGKAVNPALGDIILNEQSVRDSLAHGKFSPYKNLAFASVKDVLEKGVIVAVDSNHAVHDSYFISAPITINGKENVVTVTVHKDNTSQKMYLHGVMVKEGLLKPRVSEARRVNSRQHLSSLTSTDIHNILHHALTYKIKIKPAPISEQAKILQGKAVAVIDESTLNMPTDGGMKAIQEWATDLFAKQGGKAINPTLGEIILNHRSVKDSLAHGKFSPFKNIAFASVKDVLEKGVLVASDINEFKEESFYISAPITINGRENIVTVTVHKDSNSQRMYLHGVMIKEGLLKPRVSGTLETKSRTHSGSLTSTDIHNILHHALTYKGQSQLGGRYGTTAQDVLDVLNHHFGKDTIRRLQANGSLNIISLAEAKDKFGNIGDDADGFYTDGTAYLIHDNIHPDMVVPTFLHELGGHGGLETLMSKQAYQSLLNEFHDMVARGDKTAVQARALADKHSRNQAEADSEYLAYMITLASRNNSSKAKSLINRVIMAVKTFLKNTFGISLALTPNDILALAEKMVKERANFGINHKSTNLPQFSKSALKSVSANIKRGQKAITKAIVEKTSVHRAMYRSDIGWIDFVWGDTGRIRPNGKTKGAMGISHIFDSRTRKDGMSYADVVDMLYNDMVNAIAKGRQYDVVERDNTVRLRIIYGNHLVSLIKNKGSNAWVLTSFDIKNPTVDKVGVATLQSLRTNSPIRTRADVGALDSTNSISDDPTPDNPDIQFSRMADFYENNKAATARTLGKLGKMSTALMSSPNIDTEQPKHLPKTAYHNCQAAAQMTG